ncbi:transcriptional regulator MarR family [Actinomadura verrucosospora]|uniref:Transcriptional regulator MarR family n=1 Tax=Actinomadura verrucosospora TaxID=46165 RepID=A0A7D3W532_ACTVE|nr:transcriptional regulator MarR family [Actinomadura verrucosospora]
MLDHLRAADGPLSLAEIRHATGLGLREVADAVERLRDRGLVSIEREIDEVVRLTGR